MRNRSAGFVRIALATAVAMALAACGDSPEKLIASARQHLDKHDVAAATIELKNALAKDANLAEARYLLGKALLESGDPANAEIELKKAVDLKYSADKVSILLARSLLVRGQFKKVIDDYAAQTPADADDRAELKSIVAGAYASTGKLDDADKLYAEALTAKADYAPALLGQARIKVAANDVTGAQAIVDGVLAKNAQDVDALMFKAALRASSGQRDAAIAAYRHVIEIKPDNVAAYSALITLGLQDGKIDEVQQQLAAMQKALPKSPQTQFMQALVALQQKNLPAARDAAQAVLRAAPNDPRVLQLAGAVEFESRSDLQAQEYLTQAVARAPGLTQARRLLVRSYLRSGQTAKALAAIQPVLDSQNPPADMLALAGEAYMQAGDTTRSEALFTRAKQLDPNNTGSRTALAMIEVERGDSHGVDALEAIAATDKGTSADMALIATNMRQKHYDDALKSIAALEKKQPDNLAIYNMRAAALIGKGDVAGGRKSLEAALSINPAYFPAAASLARLDLADNKPEQASARFDAVLAKDPKNMQALLAQAELRGRMGKTQEAGDLIKRAVVAAPTEPIARAAQISFLLSQKDDKGAVAAAQDAVQAIPDRPEVLDLAGRTLQQAGNLGEAANVYGKLVTLLPNVPQSYLRLAEVQVAAKNRDAARDTLARGLRAQPDSVLLQRAVVILDVEDKRFADALNGAKAIQKQNAKDPIGYLLEGDIQATQKSWNEALAAYRAGLAKSPDSSELAMRVYGGLANSSQAAEAAKFGDTWLKSHPKDDAFRLYLATAALARADYTAAASQYRRVLESQPNNPAVMNDLAWVMGKLGDPKAIAIAEQANRLAPNQPALMDTLGALQVEHGQVAQGTDLLRKALALAPQANDIRLNLARALIKGGDKSGARTELETLSKLGDKFPGQGEVSALLKQL